MKNLALLLTTIFLLTNNTMAQDVNQKSLYLTNYTFSQTTDEVADIRLRNSDAKITSARIKDGQAAAFRIGKKTRLLFDKRKFRDSAGWVDVVIEAETSEGNLTDTFRIVRDQFIRNKVIAHRGAWKNTGASENSIAALKHAVEMGCEGSEFDVHMSADSVPFINHDPHIQGHTIATTGSELLSTIKLTNGEQLPTLENFLSAGLNQTKTKLILEIKPSSLGKEASITLARKVVGLVEKLKAQGWVDYISFDYDVCLEVMKIAPYAKVAYLNGDKDPSQLEKDHFYGFDYNNSVMEKNPDWIKQAKQKKLTVNVWTVNDAAVMKNLLSQGVDFITTNEPELLLDIVKGR